MVCLLDKDVVRKPVVTIRLRFISMMILLNNAVSRMKLLVSTLQWYRLCVEMNSIETFNTTANPHC